MGQVAHLLFQRPDRPVGDKGVDIPLARASLAAPLDVEPQEVEPLTHLLDASGASLERSSRLLTTLDPLVKNWV